MQTTKQPLPLLERHIKQNSFYLPPYYTAANATAEIMNTTADTIVTFLSIACRLVPTLFPNMESAPPLIAPKPSDLLSCIRILPMRVPLEISINTENKVVIPTPPVRKKIFNIQVYNITILT
jgi:hypothetical protein